MRTRYPGEGFRARDHGRGVRAEPLLEQRAVDAAEVRGRLQVAVVVEAVREARELADHLAAGAGADQERRPGRPGGGAGAAVLLAAAPELRPDERQDAVGEPASLEVALEGEQGARR